MVELDEVVDDPALLDGCPERERIVIDDSDMEVLLPSKKTRSKLGSNSAKVAEVVRMYFLEKLSMRQIAEAMGTSHMTVYRMLSDPNLELLI